MYRVDLPSLGTFEAWRDAARCLLSHGIEPKEVVWSRDGAEELFCGNALPQGEGVHPVTSNRDFPTLSRSVICHVDRGAPALLYQALHRHQTDRKALANPADPLSRRLGVLSKAVGRDVHKMHAFVRFRELPATGSRRRFGAWFEPDHFILEQGTPFFAKRFADMDWTIATPQGVAQFREGKLSFHPPAPRPDLPEDASEALWGTYFANIFNPARIHLKAMRSEMPLKYWKNMPETRLIPGMLEAAEARVEAMHAAMPTAAPARAERILDRLPQPQRSHCPDGLEGARHAAMTCRRCSLCEAATQTVFGSGPDDAPLMIVGEQPGDQEDLAGAPFVGPAGQLLRKIMTEAEVGPAYLTNAVKHFKFRPQGKRRLHQSPERDEIDHCRWWLDLERQVLRPRLTIALGASAAYALTGARHAMKDRRGKIEEARDGGAVLVTWHPSYILRLSGSSAEVAREELSLDLRRAEAILRDETR